MARTRSVRIVETPQELEQLRQYYGDSPEATRLLFLAFLCEDSRTTVAQAARKAGISERRGRYWWDAYRKGGVRGLLDRRVWKKSEYDSRDVEHYSFSTNTDSAESFSSSTIAFMNAIALNAKNFESAREWVPGIRHAIIALLSDVDYLVANIRHDFDVLNSDGGGGHVFRQNVGSDGTLTNESKSSGDLVKPEEGIIQAGKNQGFPFDKYHFPPTAFNYFLDPGTRSISDASDDSYIGTFLLFSLKENPPISQANIDLVERLRPFFVFLITDFIVRSNSNKGAGSEYELMLGRVAGNAGLTPREQRVLSLAFLGHSYQEIADLIFVSLNTVKSHIRSVYKKTGVKKLGEIYLKYLTSIDLDRSELDSEDYND